MKITFEQQELYQPDWMDDAYDSYVNSPEHRIEELSKRVEKLEEEVKILAKALNQHMEKHDGK
jgi:archaellum component FlaC